MTSSRSLSGTAICPGIGQGRAVLAIHGDTSDLPEMEPYVLVADSINPDLEPILANARALISDGGELSSRVINMAKELGIPCVISTKYATRRINPGDLVTVDADNNLVSWTGDLSKCVFCGKPAIVYVLRTQFFFAIYDGYPMREGHLLVIPFRHVQRIAELTQEEFSDLFMMLSQVDNLMRSTHHADGYNIGLNDGPAAGQTVPHLHFHVVPRKMGDVPNPRGGIRNFLPNPLVEYPTVYQ
jgi:Diadenosine tetraphosphate (Ap4A) hydrolase and other HIT family hydrolases